MEKDGNGAVKLDASKCCAVLLKRLGMSFRRFAVVVTEHALVNPNCWQWLHDFAGCWCRSFVNVIVLDGAVSNSQLSIS